MPVRSFAPRQKVERLALRPCADKVFTLCKASLTPIKPVFFDAKKVSVTDKSVPTPALRGKSYFAFQPDFEDGIFKKDTVFVNLNKLSVQECCLDT